MARLPRLAITGQPHLALQSGNNGQLLFMDSADRERLLGLAAELAPRLGVQLHAYVLLDSEFRWLLTPTEDNALSLWMQSVGRSYVRYFNDRHGRRGTLWEGRFRATVLQADRWLLRAMVGMDEAPVWADLALDAGSWRWSSFGHYAGTRQERFLTPPSHYWALGNTPFAREAAYVDMVRAGLSVAERTQLQESCWHGWALGEASFVENLQRLAPRRLKRGKAGRPPKASPECALD